MRDLALRVSGWGSRVCVWVWGVGVALGSAVI